MSDTEVGENHQIGDAVELLWSDGHHYHARCLLVGTQEEAKDLIAALVRAPINQKSTSMKNPQKKPRQYNRKRASEAVKVPARGKSTKSAAHAKKGRVDTDVFDAADESTEVKEEATSEISNDNEYSEEMSYYEVKEENEEDQLSCLVRAVEQSKVDVKEDEAKTGKVEGEEESGATFPIDHSKEEILIEEQEDEKVQVGGEAESTVASPMDNTMVEGSETGMGEQREKGDDPNSNVHYNTAVYSRCTDGRQFKGACRLVGNGNDILYRGYEPFRCVRDAQVAAKFGKVEEGSNVTRSRDGDTTSGNGPIRGADNPIGNGNHRVIDYFPMFVDFIDKLVNRDNSPSMPGTPIRGADGSNGDEKGEVDRIDESSACPRRAHVKKDEAKDNIDNSCTADGARGADGSSRNKKDEVDHCDDSNDCQRLAEVRADSRTVDSTPIREASNEGSNDEKHDEVFVKVGEDGHPREELFGYGDMEISDGEEDPQFVRLEEAHKSARMIAARRIADKPLEEQPTASNLNDKESIIMGKSVPGIQQQRHLINEERDPRIQRMREREEETRRIEAQKRREEKKLQWETKMKDLRRMDEEREPIQVDHQGFLLCKRGDIIWNKAVRFDVRANLGVGSFAKVERVVRTEDPRRENFALKIFKNSESGSEGRREAEIMKSLRGRTGDGQESIVQFIDEFQYGNHYCIVYPLYGISLARALVSSRNSPRPIEISDARTISRQLIEAISYLHSCGIIHTDITTKNIVFAHPMVKLTKLFDYVRGRTVHVMSHAQIRLIDLGSAVATSMQHEDLVSSAPYRAPEVYLGMPWSAEIDLWALGCVIMECFKGHQIFQFQDEIEETRCFLAMAHKTIGSFPREMAKKACEWNWRESSRAKQARMTCTPLENYRDDNEGECADLVDLVMELLRHSPRERISLDGALRHPFFAPKPKERTIPELPYQELE